jgi:hypothetical protein
VGARPQFATVRTPLCKNAWNVCVCVCVCVYSHVCVCVCVFSYARTHAHTHTLIQRYELNHPCMCCLYNIRVYMCVCMFMCVWVCVYIYISVDTIYQLNHSYMCCLACVYVCICMCIYTYLYVQHTSWTTHTWAVWRVYTCVYMCVYIHFCMYNNIPAEPPLHVLFGARVTDTRVFLQQRVLLKVSLAWCCRILGLFLSSLQGLSRRLVNRHLYLGKKKHIMDYSILTTCSLFFFWVRCSASAEVACTATRMYKCV